MTCGRTISFWLVTLYFCRIRTRSMRLFGPATSQSFVLYVAMLPNKSIILKKPVDVTCIERWVHVYWPPHHVVCLHMHCALFKIYLTAHCFWSNFEDGAKKLDSVHVFRILQHYLKSHCVLSRRWENDRRSYSSHAPAVVRAGLLNYWA